MIKFLALMSLILKLSTPTHQNLPSYYQKPFTYRKKNKLLLVKT